MDNKSQAIHEVMFTHVDSLYRTCQSCCHNHMHKRIKSTSVYQLHLHICEICSVADLTLPICWYNYYLQNQQTQRNSYASEKEMRRSKITKEEFSDCSPSLYAVTVLAGEFKIFPLRLIHFCNNYSSGKC